MKPQNKKGINGPDKDRKRRVGRKDGDIHNLVVNRKTIGSRGRVFAQTCDIKRKERRGRSIMRLRGFSTQGRNGGSREATEMEE